MAPGRRLPCRRRLLHYTRKYVPWQRQLAVMDASARLCRDVACGGMARVNRRSAAKQDSGGAQGHAGGPGRRQVSHKSWHACS